MAQALFLTGADGYVGSRLLRALAAGGHEKIYCLTRRREHAEAGRTVAFVRGDILDSGAYAGSLAGCETVVHLAAVTGKNRPEEYFRVNAEGTRILIQTAKKAGVRNFLHVSTIAVKFPNQFRYYYGQSKKQAEEAVASSGLRYTIVRPTMIFGEGAPVLEGLARLAGAPVVPVFGDGRTRVQPIFVDDLVNCLLAILRRGLFENRILEAGGPEAIAIEDLLMRIRRARYGKPPRAVHVPLGLIVPALAALEKVALPVLPLTAGQLASFRNDGTIEASASAARLCAPRAGIDQMLGRAATG